MDLDRLELEKIYSQGYGFYWKGKGQAIKEVENNETEYIPYYEGNLYIEGDNLVALKSLQKEYKGKIKCIYIDPPYNTNKKFLYNDKFRKSKKDSLSNGDRIHTNWLNMMYPRLILARNLLTEDGVIFISIDDKEQAQLKLLCDDIFGENNFVTNIHWRRSESQNNNAKQIAVVGEFILCYVKNKATKLFNKIELQETALKEYRYIDEKTNKRFRRGTIIDKSRGKNIFTVVSPDGIKKEIKSIRTKEFFDEANSKDMVYWTKTGTPYLKIFLENIEGQISNNWFDNVGVNEDSSELLNKLGINFSFSKPVSLIEKLLEISGDKKSIILDFFAGSGTTGHAVMKLNAEDGGNRRYIMVQLPEPCDEKSEAYKAGYKNICEIGKERIRRAGKKIKADESLPLENREKLDTGFKVVKL